MRINNANDFVNFVKGAGMINISPESSAVVQCVEEFQRMCACDPPAARNAKLNKCRTLYINFVHRVSQYKDALLSKTPDGVIGFGIDGQLITTLTR